MTRHASIPDALGLAASRRHARGFTLTELMAVVVIIGILSALALVGYTKYLNSAKASEASHMVSAIRAAEEAYRAETLSYLDVSGSLAKDKMYPTTDPSDVKVQWGAGADEVAKNWRILNVSTDGAVYYGYAVVAGPPGNVEPPGMPGAPDFLTVVFPVAVEPWYVVLAMGNVNGDSIYSYYMASSLSNEVYWVREGE